MSYVILVIVFILIVAISLAAKVSARRKRHAQVIDHAVYRSGIAHYDWN